MPAAAAKSRRLGWREMLRFHAPLATNAVLLTLAGPILNMVLGRGPEPSLQLAAFWIAFTVVLVAQSLCGVLQQTTTALAARRGFLGALAVAALASGLGSSALVLLLGITPLGDIFFRFVIPAAPPIASLAKQVLVTLSPVPLLIALRSVASGLVVASRRTHVVAMTTLVRIAVVLLAAGLVMALRREGGAHASAWMLLSGILAEAGCVVAAAISRLEPGRLRVRRAPNAYRAIVQLAGPIAVATLAWAASRGVIHAVLGHLPQAGLAQAGFGVILPLLMLTCSPLWVMLDVALVLPASGRDFGRVLAFAVLLCAFVSSALAWLTLSHMGQAWLAQVFRLSGDLAALLSPMLGWLALAPPLVAARAIAQALLMRAHRTRVMMITGPARVLLMLIGGLAIAWSLPSVNGASLALALLLGADAFDAVLLGMRARLACAAAGGLEALLSGAKARGARRPLKRIAPGVVFEPGELRSAA